MSPLATAVASCAALTALLTVWTLGALARQGLWRRAAPAVLPLALRTLWPLSQVLVTPLRRAVPPALLGRVETQLLRCDLDGLIDAPQWLALRGMLALLSGVAVAALAQLAQWPVLPCGLAGAALGGMLSGHWLSQRRAARERQILKDLPANLDVLTLCVEAGATLTAALRMLVDKSGDTPLRAVFARVLREVRAGRTRLEALEHVARLYRLPCLDALVMAMMQSESAGMSLGAVLRAQAGQRAAERHQRAERLALQAPVKMLVPLVLCIFPCTFVVLAVPVVARLLSAGAP